MKETVNELLKKTSIKPQSDFGEDIVVYRNSIMIGMERQSAPEFAKEEVIEVGKMEVALEMKKKGMLLVDIKLFTGLSEQPIENLLRPSYQKKKHFLCKSRFTRSNINSLSGFGI